MAQPVSEASSAVRFSTTALNREMHKSQRRMGHVGALVQGLALHA